MPINFCYDGKTLDVDDVPLSVYGDIEQQTKVAWYQLTTAPMRHAVAAELLAKECAKILGIDDLPVLTPKLLVTIFEVVNDENKPSEYQNGSPDPKAKGSDRATTSSSGSRST